MTRMEDHPHNKLTHIGDEMLKTFDALTGDDEVFVVIMLNFGSDGAICLHGYEEPLDAFPDIIVHMNQMAKASGKQVVMIPVKGPPMNNPEAS